jgi:hypothetical protein
LERVVEAFPRILPGFWIVITGLDPVIHLLREICFLRKICYEDRWMPGSSPGMTSHSRGAKHPRFANDIPLSHGRGRRECRALAAPAASHAK